MATWGRIQARPSGGADSWIVQHPGAAPRALRLICFAAAGAGASSFRDWGAALGRGVEVVAVQLPGREGRLREAPYTSMDALVAALPGALADQLQGRFAFYGHSMGALVAYELARALVADGRTPRHLVVASHRAPPLPPRRGPLHDAPDDELVAALEALAGTPPEVLDHPELRRLILPTVRADLRLCWEYRAPPVAPLPCPITAFGGVDDPSVSAAEIDAWRQHTAGPFTMRLFAGGHFFEDRDPERFFAELATTLGAAGSARR